MPYYCTVPRCTSMAGKAKNVSFHQFPRDEELAKLWNKILKRGKPYTKYSKVCSLHFKPEDYSITSVGKNKGQWRTLRKDAIPSQNLPSDSPVPYHRHRNTDSWHAESPSSGIIDTQVHQHMAQAIYMQTMLAMQAAGSFEGNDSNNDSQQNDEAHSSSENHREKSQSPIANGFKASLRCSECSKYFKDPDVFVLHQRTHRKHNEKENLNTNTEELKPEMDNFNINGENTLKSNPILANLLKSTEVNQSDVHENVSSIENHIMAAVKVSMETYLRNLLISQSILPDAVDEKSSDLNSDCDRGVTVPTDTSNCTVNDGT
ncbi:unnamed protein product [Chilo suppressalis]|uniref:THAP-type domain-containing protein n=1 Tax=Chilo suppressalis TaxID=168631 RepID=A0ABN8BA15_CHISP|nr:unnamed protein product [Chilo suppressalis]